MIASQKPDDSKLPPHEIHNQNLVNYSFESLVQRHSREFRRSRQLNTHPQNSRLEKNRANTAKPLGKTNQPKGAASGMSKSSRAAVRLAKTASLLIIGGILGFPIYKHVDITTGVGLMKLFTEHGEKTQERPFDVRQALINTEIAAATVKTGTAANVEPPETTRHDPSNSVTPVVVSGEKKGESTSQSYCPEALNALHLCGDEN